MNLDTIRNSVSSLIADLRRTHMLPVVGLLVIAAIALPFVLSRSGTAAPVPPVSSVPSFEAPSMSATTPAHRSGTSWRKRYLDGAWKDPFIQQATTASKTTTGSASSGSLASGAESSLLKAVSSGSTGSSGSSAGASSSGSTIQSALAGLASAASKHVVTVTVPVRVTATTVTQPTTTPSFVYTTYSVDVLFGKASGTQTEFHNLGWFGTLPSASNPILTFLGVEKDRQSAVFLVASGVQVAGQGHCTPTASNCNYLVMAPGGHVALVETGPNGDPTEYELSYKSATEIAVNKTGRARARRLDARTLRRAERALPGAVGIVSQRNVGAPSIVFAPAIAGSYAVTTAKESAHTKAG